MIQSLSQTTEAVRRSFEGSRAGADALGKLVGTAARGSQTIGIEWLDYLKQVSTEAAAVTEKVVKSGSPAKAIEIQSAFMRASGEQFVARAATFRDLYATLAQDMAKPFAVLAERRAA